MHQSQLDFRQLSSEMMENLREEFYDALTPGNSTPITMNQQCHLTQQQAYHNKFNQQQAYLNQSTNISNLMSIIQDLKKEVKSFKENKENLKPNKKYLPKKALKHCWTHGCQTSHQGDDFWNPLPNHCERATLDNNIGGTKVGMNYCKPKRNKK